MPRFPLDEPTPPTPEAPLAQPVLHELIAWMRQLEERVRKLELVVNLDPNEPAQALGILIDERDDV